jgi:hypothetical protein
MVTRQLDRSVSRRAALAGLSAGGVTLVAGGHSSAAQDATMSDHPMVGIWLGVTPDGPSPAFFQADGAFFGSSAPVSLGPDGTLQFVSQQNGTWEPDPDVDRGIHFTSVQNVHDATGVYTGTVTVDGYPVASEDGQSFYDDGKRVRITVRDPAGTVLMVLGEDGSLPPVFGNRMAPGAPGFQEATPEAATPAP